MRILVAPGSYKGTLTSSIAADIIVSTVRELLPSASVEKLVLADGGEGTLEAFSAHFGCVTEIYSVRNSVGTRIVAPVGFMAEDTAVIETAQAIGLSLIAPSQRDPHITSSYGVGELIQHAARRGARRQLVTLGDSSTMDMGIGMLSALGVKFYSAAGEIASPNLAHLSHIVDFDDRALHDLRERVTFVGLADTDDYLCGDIGQVRLFGKQKGLTESMIPVVEAAYLSFAAVIQRRLGVDVTTVVRASGSGGIGAALHAFFRAELLNTLEYMARDMNVDARIGRADVVITGEGCWDAQTKLGKVPHFVASRAANRCIGIVGSFTLEGWDDMTKVCRQSSVFCLNPEITMTNPRRALRDAVVSIFSLMA